MPQSEILKYGPYCMLVYIAYVAELYVSVDMVKQAEEIRLSRNIHIYLDSDWDYIYRDYEPFD